jgi:hypothetical protein
VGAKAPRPRHRGSQAFALWCAWACRTVPLCLMASASLQSAPSPRLVSLILISVTFVLLSIASAREAERITLLPFQTTLPQSSSDCVRLSLSATSCSTFSRIASLAYWRLAMVVKKLFHTPLRGKLVKRMGRCLCERR